MTSNSTASDNQTLSLSPNGASGISATVRVKGLSVSGKAKGLDPGKRYISLYYGSMSTPQPGQTHPYVGFNPVTYPVRACGVTR